MDGQDWRSNSDDQTIGEFAAVKPSSHPSGPDFRNLAAILPAGTVLGGRYAIIEILGLGGMGAVYKAEDRQLDRMVAVKVIRPDLAENPSILQRFKQEIILARQIT